MSFQILISGSISLGATQSNAIQLNEGVLAGITTGSNISGSIITFLVSADNVTYAPLYGTDSTEVSITQTSGSVKAFTLNANNFYPWNWVKLQEGTSASPIAQKVVATLFTANVKNL